MADDDQNQNGNDVIPPVEPDPDPVPAPRAELAPLKTGQKVTYLDHDGETRIPATVLGESIVPNPIPNLKIQPGDRRFGNQAFPGPYYDIALETDAHGERPMEYVPQVTLDMRTDDLHLAGVVVVE